MKKLLISLALVTTLSGCTLLDAYLMANFDNIEYKLVNKIRTTSEISSKDCANREKSVDNFVNMYYTAIEFRNYSQFIPRNEDTYKIAVNLVELTKQGKELYEKPGTVSETFCKLKLGQINRTTQLAQEVIGKKPRI